ncbi:TetR/AcrR family transcriptional regulator [Leucobacter chromiireducens]|uniref:TetR/AcrR family transcriptional regulator n=1 Tax=Leucobacter chromiireducens TaxID=283877 RepID=UPI000F644936|nr:TetR/AcrR family transcriptional regulator [Leucobacter chromiireducens]
MAYLPREERRAAMIDAALAVIRADGFAAVSARSVAQAVGGSPGLVHQHFASVTELTGLAWRHYVAGNLAEFSAAVGGAGAAAVPEFFANHLDEDRAAELGLWADALAHALRVPEFGEVFAGTLAELVDALRGADPDLTEPEADRVVLLGIALAGMRRVAPERYGVARVVEIVGAERGVTQ